MLRLECGTLVFRAESPLILGWQNDPLPPVGLTRGALFQAKVPELPQGVPKGSREASPSLCPSHQAWLLLAVRAQLQARGWLLLGSKEGQGVPGRRGGGRGWWKLPRAAGTRLGRGGGPRGWVPGFSHTSSGIALHNQGCLVTAFYFFFGNNFLSITAPFSILTSHRW